MDEQVSKTREGEINKTYASNCFTYLNNGDNNINRNSECYNMKSRNLCNQGKEQVSFNLSNIEKKLSEKNNCELSNETNNIINNELKIDNRNTDENNYMDQKKEEFAPIEQVSKNKEKNNSPTENGTDSENEHIVNNNNSDHNDNRNNAIFNDHKKNEDAIKDNILYNSIKDYNNIDENGVDRKNRMMHNIKDMKTKILENYLIENNLNKNRRNIYDSYNFNYNSFKLLNEESSSDETNYECVDNENNFIENFNFLNFSKVNMDKAYDVINMYLPCIEKKRKEKKKKHIYSNNNEVLYNMANLKLTGTSVILTNENSKFIYKIIPFFKNGEANFYINVFSSFNYIYKNHKKIKNNENIDVNSAKKEEKKNYSNFYNKMHDIYDYIQNIKQNIIKQNSVKFNSYYKGSKNKNKPALSSSYLMNHNGIINSDDSSWNMIEENKCNMKNHSLDNTSDINSNYKEKSSLNSYFSKKLSSDFFSFENILKKSSSFYDRFESAKTNLTLKFVNKKNSMYDHYIENKDQQTRKKEQLNNELNNVKQEIEKLKYNKNLNSEINKNIYSNENSMEGINSNFIDNEVISNNHVPKNIANENGEISDEYIFKMNKKINVFPEKDIKWEEKKNILNEKFILSFLVKHKLIPKCYNIVPVYKCKENEEKNEEEEKAKEEKIQYENSENYEQENIKKMLSTNQTNKELNHNEKYYNVNKDIKKNKINEEKNINERIKNGKIETINENNICKYQNSKSFYNEIELNEKHKNYCKSEKSSNKGIEKWKVGNYSNVIDENIENVHLALKLKKVCNKIKYSDQEILDLKLGYNTLKDNDLSYNEELIKDSELLSWDEKEKYVKKWSKMKKKIRAFYTNTSDQHIIHISSKDLNLPSSFNKYNNNEIYCLLKSWKQNITSLKTTQKILGFRICSLIHYINYENVLNDEYIKEFYSDFMLKKNIIEKNKLCENEKLMKYAEKKKVEIKDCYEDTNKRLKIDRKLGLKLSEEQVLYFLTIFLKNVVYIILPKLLNLKLWLEEQSLYYFCSTSLLIIYDKKNPFSCDIKWIDFTYSFENLNYLKKKKKINTDILFGLNNIIKLCKTIFFNNNIPPSISYYENQENTQE